MIGEILDGTYRIESIIGRGGMGVVYKARHERLDGYFAVKVLHVSNEERGPRLVARFRREARITSALAHPHIVAVTDTNVTHEGSPYLVMELLEGEDLACHLRRKGELSLTRVALILQQVAAALQSAHDAGVVHRDLKPSNIFLCRRPNDEVQVKVLDFGISKVAGSQTSMTLTEQMIGTPAFMAPEQAQGDSARVDHRADIFSVGAMLYSMLAGKKPFGGESVPEMLFKVVYEHPPPLLEARADLPAALVHVIERALSKRVEARQPSIAELWQEFRAAAELGDAVATLSATRWRLTQRIDLKALEAQGQAQRQGQGFFGAETEASREVVQSDAAPTPVRAAATAAAPAPAPALAPAIVAAGGLRWRSWALLVGVVVLVAAGSLVLGLRLARRGGEGGAPNDGRRVSSTSLRAESGQNKTTDVRIPLGHDGGSAKGPTGVNRWRGSKKARRRHTASMARAALRVSAINQGRSVPAMIYLDGKSVGQAPLLLKELRPGLHRLEARKSGMKPKRQRVRLRAGKEARVVLKLRSR